MVSFCYVPKNIVPKLRSESSPGLRYYGDIMRIQSHLTVCFSSGWDSCPLTPFLQLYCARVTQFTYIRN